MCHHLFNSLSTIRNIYRGNNHSSFNRNFIDLQPEEEKTNIWDGFSLHRKKRHLSCSVLPQLWQCQCRARAGSPSLVQPPQSGCSGRCCPCRSTGSTQSSSCGPQTLPAPSPHTCFAFTAVQEEPWPFSLLLHSSWSCSFSVWPQSVHALSTFARVQKCPGPVQKLWPCQLLLHRDPKSISLRMALQTPCLGWDGWQSRRDHKQMLLVLNYFSALFRQTRTRHHGLFSTQTCVKEG